MAEADTGGGWSGGGGGGDDRGEESGSLPRCGLATRMAAVESVLPRLPELPSNSITKDGTDFSYRIARTQLLSPELETSIA